MSGLYKPTKAGNYGTITPSAPETVVLPATTKKTTTPSQQQQQGGDDDDDEENTEKLVLGRADFYPRVMHFHMLTPITFFFVWICVWFGFFCLIDYDQTKVSKIAPSWALFLFTSFGTFTYAIRAVKHILFFPMYSQRFNTGIANCPSLTTSQNHFLSLCFHGTIFALGVFILFWWFVAIPFTMTRGDIYHSIYTEGQHWGGIVAGEVFTALFSLVLFFALGVNTTHAYKRFALGGNYMPHVPHPYTNDEEATDRSHIIAQEVYAYNQQQLQAAQPPKDDDNDDEENQSTTATTSQIDTPPLFFSRVWDFRYLGFLFNLILLIMGCVVMGRTAEEIDDIGIQFPFGLLITVGVLCLGWYIVHLNKVFLKYPKYSAIYSQKRTTWAMLELFFYIFEIIFHSLIFFFFIIAWCRIEPVMSDADPFEIKYSIGFRRFAQMLFSLVFFIYLAYFGYLYNLVLFIKDRKLMLKQAIQTRSLNDFVQDYDEQVDEYEQQQQQQQHDQYSTAQRDVIEPDVV